MKNDIHEGEMLKLKLREKGLNMLFVAQKLGISRQTLYNHLHKEKLDPKFYIYVQAKFNLSPINMIIEDDVIISNPNVQDTTQVLKTDDNDIWLLQAQMKAITHATAKLMSKSSGRDILACLEELEQDAKLFYKEKFVSA